MHILAVHLLYIRIRSRFLRSKIIRRKPHDHQSLILVVLLDFIEHRVLLVKNRLSGQIDNHQHLPFVRRQ